MLKILKKLFKVVVLCVSLRIRPFLHIPADMLDDCLDLALLAPNSSNLQPWTFYVVQNPTKKKQLVKACLNQLAAKTASELIVCVARTDRNDEMAKRNITEFPFPEAPASVLKYYKFIPYIVKSL